MSTTGAPTGDGVALGRAAQDTGMIAKTLADQPEETEVPRAARSG